MRVPLRWLRDYVNIGSSPEQLGKRLTLAGLEVTEIRSTAGAWDGIVVGQVVNVGRHPNADRLGLATVDLGTERVTVVCGAPNVSSGQKVPFARVGADLIDGRTGDSVRLKTAKIRGVVSEGMVCAEKELGISDNYDGIMVLPPDAPTGVPLAEYLGDVVLDIDITPNRPDCLSVVGIAREIAALTGESLRLPVIEYEEHGEAVGSCVSVDVREPRLCPRYCASLVSGIRIAPSPAWLQQYVSACGMRPINNVVDVTNFVMLEYGQPLHAFDYEKLRGKRIIVRRAEGGEMMYTLDGVERPLNSDTLVIADRDRAIALAGIMGGADTEVTEATSTILLESANFSPAAINRGCSLLQFQSEASIRFAKGLNSRLPLVPLQRATQMLVELADGRAAKGILDVYPGESPIEAVSVSTREVKRLSGVSVSADRMRDVLTALGFRCVEDDGKGSFSVNVPYWRSDIKCGADLVEETVRMVGYDKIPVTRLSSTLPEQRSQLSMPVRRSNLRRKLGRILVGCGFQEVLTYSLVGLDRLRRLSPDFELDCTPLKVANPMTREQEYLRTSLRVGLLTALAQNQRFGHDGVRFFEIGKVFLPQGSALPDEREMLCAILCGMGGDLSWHGDSGVLDFFDAKGVVEELLRHLGLAAEVESANHRGLFSGRTADLIAGGEAIGVVGDVHPRVAQAFEISGTVSLLELDLEKLLLVTSGLKEYRPIPRFPSVSRDVALVADEQVSYQQIQEIVETFPLVSSVTLFDLYRGEQVPQGKKSFALRVLYQSPDRTLTDEEVEGVQSKMLERLNQELGTVLRA